MPRSEHNTTVELPKATMQRVKEMGQRRGWSQRQLLQEAIEAGLIALTMRHEYEDEVKALNQRGKLYADLSAIARYQNCNVQELCNRILTEARAGQHLAAHHPLLGGPFPKEPLPKPKASTDYTRHLTPEEAEDDDDFPLLKAPPEAERVFAPIKRH